MESGDFVIQLYSDLGAIETQYFWVLGSDLGDGFADGWYEEDMETIVNKTFDIGEAFNVLTTKGGNLTYAGQVIAVQTVVPTRPNLSCQGNFRPVAVDIQSITPAVPEGNVMESGDFVIQFYSDLGAIETQYFWVLGSDLGDGFADGWYEEDMETIVKKTFAAGEGFNVLTTKGGTLTFPALSL